MRQDCVSGCCHYVVVSDAASCLLLDLFLLWFLSLHAVAPKYLCRDYFKAKTKHILFGHVDL